MNSNLRIDRTCRAFAAIVGLPVAFSLAACSGDGPASPTIVAAGVTLRVEAFQTSTQTEVSGNRVQVRLRISGGLLAEAQKTGAAIAQVCLSGACVDKPLAGFAEGDCSETPTIAAGNARLGLAVAWLDGAVAGVDICARDLSEPMTFETMMSDGVHRSNVVRTACTPSAVGLFCVSG